MGYSKKGDDYFWNSLKHVDFVLETKILLVLYSKKIFFPKVIFLYFFEIPWQENPHNMSENLPQMSAEERERANSKQQAGCSSKKVRFWKCPMILSIIQWL
jgi:hypothetical protein